MSRKLSWHERLTWTAKVTPPPPSPPGAAEAALAVEIAEMEKLGVRVEFVPPKNCPTCGQEVYEE